MKYLKKFNESKKQDLEDIILELKDLGIDAYINDDCIDISNYGRPLRWRKIKDCVLRLINYLGDLITKIYV